MLRRALVMTDIYIGFDQKDAIAAEVCASSIRRRSRRSIRFLKQTDPDVCAIFERPWHRENGNRVDDRDGKPFSTEFAFTRFLVPYLNKWEGWAIFCDADMLWLASPDELFAKIDDRYAVMCVKHNHVPVLAKKMDGVKQTVYPRKNWSSMVLWNCAHPHNRCLSPSAINHIEGSYLHGFYWLKDDEIGELDPSWNYLVGYTNSVEPKIVHFTEGLPTMKGYQDVPYADAWADELHDYVWDGR